MKHSTHEHYSKGDQVFVHSGVHRGRYGTVENMSNAGFQGLLYSLRTESGEYLPSISATCLVISVAQPIVAWPHQVTYRDGKRIGPG